MKSWVSERFYSNFWEERGEKLMTCHLFLDNFSWNFMTFELFSKVKSFETDFCFKKTRISRFRYHEIFVFSWILSFAKDTVSQKFDCVFVLAIRGLLHMNKNFVIVEWFLCFNHYYGNLLKSFPKRIMVLSKTCVRFRNRIFKRFE